MYQPFQIVWARVNWKGCPDERPWLILDIRENGQCYGAFPISSKHYTSAGPYTVVPADHEDFAASGLKLSSYIFYESIVEIGSEEIRKSIGVLVGGLRHVLVEESGI